MLSLNIRTESISVSDSSSPTQDADILVRDLPLQTIQRPLRAGKSCPECGQVGKSIHWQTVKSMLSVSLRQVLNAKYFFCRTQNCPVVYFSADGEQTFNVEHVRERVFQKEPEAAEVNICYCFLYAVGELRAASPEGHAAIVNEINTGVNAGQCACDLRNPQGTCCLGNVRELIKQLEQPEHKFDGDKSAEL